MKKIYTHKELSNRIDLVMEQVLKLQNQRDQDQVNMNDRFESLERFQHRMEMKE